MTILIALISISQALPGADATWTKLTSKPTKADCTIVDGDTWCRAQAVFATSADIMRDTLTHMSANADKFESVVEIEELSPSVMHVVMDFPMPLADRDYVAKYSQVMGDDGVFHIQWEPVPDAPPPTDGRVRLEKFAGEWTIAPTADGNSTITYTWHASYGGSLPNFAMNTARKKTASEALKDLAQVAGTTMSLP